MALSRDRFLQCEDLFHVALTLTGEDRAAFLERSCAQDPELRAQVERLLAAHDRAGDFISSPAIPEPAEGNAASVGWVGRLVGPYRVVREIGRGGMGAVYLAERADGQYQQRVALKVIKRGMDTDQVLARFRAERQILASLDHPNIARLLDGGSTEQGVPFFAMEYIEGEPIDAWADRRALSVEERLRLFLQVCAAVTYAHQHLVVHRDIKPLNILVTVDGVPKLLDFGIAKVLHEDPDQATSTVTGMRLLTPEYASPEQVEGRHATTASDVYSLGVVLYELLTGRSPYRPRSRAPLDVVEAVRTTDPERPSSIGGTEKLRRRLRGDLDIILLTALRKEPARRYQSVEQFAGDLRRHLEGLPVRARPDTFGYRAGKFVRRNRVPVAAGLLLALALLGGTAATAYQAQQARAAQARAERRFADVRKLANAVLFDYHDAIKDLRGARPVRERLVRDALGYLDGLARESREDPSLQRELAGAYRRVGDLQGGEPGSLGDNDGAISSYGKALAIFDTLVRSDSANPRLRREAAGTALSLGRVVWQRGDPAAGLGHARRAQALLDPLVAAAPSDTDLRLQLSDAYNLLGQISLEQGRIPQALAFHRADLQQLEAAPASQRKLPTVRYAISVAYGYLADAQAESGDLTGALESHRRSRALRTELTAEFPDNATYAESNASARYYEATMLGRLGRWEASLAIFRKLLAENPAASFYLCRVGEALAALDRSEDALGYLQRALRRHEEELRADSVSLFTRLAIVEDLGRICKVVARLGRADASAACRRATTFTEGITVEPTHAFPRAFIAAAWSDMGEAYETLGRRESAPLGERRTFLAAATDRHRRSHEIWIDLKARGLVSPVDTGRITASAAAVARAGRVATELDNGREAL
jgi:tetratricopeptide (TPR) repeat protein/tRNA A-37 threonylcarbamoyl transferase component Bud32